MTQTEEGDPYLGTLVGGCRIEGLLGQGGMGSVYRAHHIALDKPVAMKILATFLSRDKDYIQRFVQEARAAARLEHPNIVQVLNVAQQNEVYFMILQYVEGESLEALLKRERKLDLAQATRIAYDVASGLSAAHESGIIHRDIKPANVLLGKDGFVKITDFGLARHMDKGSNLTVSGVFMGTPDYVAPEQADGRTVDHRADLYALGVTYYHMLAGRLPFVGRSPVEVAAMHVRDAPPPLASVAPGVDPRAAVLAHRLLEKDPRARYANAADLKADLAKILGPAHLPTPRSTQRISPSTQVATKALEAKPPPPPPRPLQPFPPAPSSATTATGPIIVPRRQASALSNLVFWLLGLGGAGLLFAGGVLGSGHPDGGFWDAWVRPFLERDECFRKLLAFTGGGFLALLAGLYLNRGVVHRCFWPSASIFILSFAGVLFYGAGAHLAAGEGHPTVDGALAAVRASWPHPSQMPLFAAWGVITGLILGVRADAKGPGRAAGVVVILAAGALVYLFVRQTAGVPAASFAPFHEESWIGLGATGVTLAGGLLTAFGKKNNVQLKAAGAVSLLLSLGAVYGLAVASLPVPEGGKPPYLELVQPLLPTLAAHGGLLSGAVLTAVWGVWLLYTRSPLYRGRSAY